MSIMNGFLFLMLGLAGITVGLVLIELKRAEQQAARDIMRIQYHSDKPVMRLPAVPEQSSYLEEINQGYELRHESYSDGQNKPAFFSIPVPADNQPASLNDSAVCYDFAIASRPDRKEQAMACLLLDNSYTDHCA